MATTQWISPEPYQRHYALRVLSLVLLLQQPNESQGTMTKVVTDCKFYRSENGRTQHSVLLLATKTMESLFSMVSEQWQTSALLWLHTDGWTICFCSGQLYLNFLNVSLFNIILWRGYLQTESCPISSFILSLHGLVWQPTPSYLFGVCFHLLLATRTTLVLPLLYRKLTQPSKNGASINRNDGDLHSLH